MDGKKENDEELTKPKKWQMNCESGHIVPRVGPLRNTLALAEADAREHDAEDHKGFETAVCLEVDGAAGAAAEDGMALPANATSAAGALKPPASAQRMGFAFTVGIQSSGIVLTIDGWAFPPGAALTAHPGFSGRSGSRNCADIFAPPRPVPIGNVRPDGTFHAAVPMNLPCLPGCNVGVLLSCAGVRDNDIQTPDPLPCG